MFENCKIVFLHVCDQPTGCTGLPGVSRNFVRQASAASGLVANVQKYNFAIFKHFLRLPEAPKQKRRVIFELSMKFCICGAQKLKMFFFSDLLHFFHGSTPPWFYHGIISDSTGIQTKVISVFNTSQSSETPLGMIICVL